MWISAGEHELAENIVHLVLAQDRRRAAGREGHLAVHRAASSWSTRTAALGARNDVWLAGLNHKMG